MYVSSRFLNHEAFVSCHRNVAFVERCISICRCGLRREKLGKSIILEADLKIKANWRENVTKQFERRSDSSSGI